MGTPTLPQSRGLGPTVQQAPLPVPQVPPAAPAAEGEDDPYDLMIAQQYARMNARVHKPMYTPEQQQERVATNEREYQLGLLGTLTGRAGLSDAGGQVLKNALALRQPKVTERGVSNMVTGEFNYDPEYLAEKDDVTLRALQQAKIARANKREDAAQANEWKKALLGQSIEGKKQVKAIGGGGGSGAKSDDWGFDAGSGQRINMTKTGDMIVKGYGPTGEPIDTPYTGTAPVPKKVAEEHIQNATIAQRTGDHIDKMLQAVKDTPTAFGMGATFSQAVGNLGSAGAAAQPYVNKVLEVSPEVMQLRAKIIRDAAIETHDLYGAAQSRGEEKKAQGFLVTGNEGFESAMAKLQAAREYAKTIELTHGGTFARIARERTGNVPVGTPPAAAPGIPATLGKPGDKEPKSTLTPAQRAELDKLRAESAAHTGRQ